MPKAWKSFLASSTKAVKRVLFSPTVSTFQVLWDATLQSSIAIAYTAEELSPLQSRHQQSCISRSHRLYDDAGPKQLLSRPHRPQAPEHAYDYLARIALDCFWPQTRSSSNVQGFLDGSRHWKCRIQRWSVSVLVLGETYYGCFLLSLGACSLLEI